MTAAMWAILLPAIVALIGSVAGYLKAQTANVNARKATVNSVNAKFSAASANLAASAAKRMIEVHLGNDDRHVTNSDVPPVPEPAPNPGNVYTLPTETDRPDAS